MTSVRAPSYFRWAKENPVTTNQTYGYSMHEQFRETKPKAKPKGPNDYTRPFSNSAFFPMITYPSLEPQSTKPMPVWHPSRAFCPKGTKNRFDINRGYTFGPLPVVKRMVPSVCPAGLMWRRSISAPPAFKEPEPQLKDVYLWHTLAGTLVHVKNPK